jgi:L-glyceraldehyde 3-phosphate reductase
MNDSNNESYLAAENRYDVMQYQRCGHSGLKLPKLSLGLWHNFGGVDDYEKGRSILKRAFDSGITHFDLANNYGPPPGSAESNFGRILQTDFRYYRDELVISTKAGYKMWNGPYGDWGSKKYLISSLDQSLKRLQLEYVDIFYHHRPDPETPLDETIDALTHIIRQGKALYIGLSNYRNDDAARAFTLLRQEGINCLIHQPRYSMFERWVENGLLDILEEHHVGCIPFSPLAQGLLTDKYLRGIPLDSRAGKENTFLKKDVITPEKIATIRQLNDVAVERGQSLAQMAIAWLLKDKRITSVLIGASSPEQITDSCNSLKNLTFSKEELDRIEGILAQVK